MPISCQKFFVYADLYTSFFEGRRRMFMYIFNNIFCSLILRLSFADPSLREAYSYIVSVSFVYLLKGRTS